MVLSKHVQRTLKQIEQELVDHQDDFNMTDERLGKVVATLRRDVSDKEEENLYNLVEHLNQFRRELFLTLTMVKRGDEAVEEFSYDKLPRLYKKVKAMHRVVEHEILEWETRRNAS